MKTYHVKLAVQILEIYELEAQDAEEAAELWCEGRLIHTNDEALESQVLSVEEVRP